MYFLYAASLGMFCRTPRIFVYSIRRRWSDHKTWLKHTTRIIQLLVLLSLVAIYLYTKYRYLWYSIQKRRINKITKSEPRNSVLGKTGICQDWEVTTVRFLKQKKKESCNLKYIWCKTKTIKAVFLLLNVLIKNEANSRLNHQFLKNYIGKI